MRAADVATIIALVVGPALAVVIARWLDDRRFREGRRMDVFRTLMRTRRMRLSPDHVGALNMVEVEFAGEENVIDAWKKYWAHLSQLGTPGLTPAQVERLVRDQDGLLTKLLHAIATSLGFKIQQLDIFEGGYAPQGWLNDEQSFRELRFLLLEVLNGRRGIPFASFNAPSASSLYPPPPDVN